MIYFFYPSSIIGGAENLMVNTANLLCNAGLSVGVVDFKNGWVVNNITSPLIKKEYLYKNKKIQLDEKDVLITTANYIYKLDNYFLESDARVLFWVVQPYNVILGLPNIISENKIFQVLLSKYMNKQKVKHIKNLKLIINKNSIVSMDSECDRILNYNYSLNYKYYLPIFVDDSRFSQLNVLFKKNNAIEMVWLGRIDLEFKIHILKKLLLDLNLYKNFFNTSLEFNIIGEGPGLESLKSFVDENIEFKIKFLGELRGDDLSTVLVQSDIGFAMGTSALEIAAKKTPTVLLDFSYNEVLDYKYRWIFETDCYVLGRDIDFLTKVDVKNMKKLELIFSELIDNNKMVAESSFNYVLENHSSKNILNLLEDYVINAELTIRDIYQYRSTKPFWNKIWYYLMKFRRYL